MFNQGVKEVSTPHRFNSHYFFKGPGISQIPVSIPHRFNSHLTSRFISPHYQCGFQSLTGSIHTKFSFSGSTRRWLVSIPHRFNSHQGVAIGGDVYGYSFNPSQVQFTPKIINFDFGIKIVVSIPHRFNSHPNTQSIPTQGVNVSIPHRFNSHHKLKAVLTQEKLSFNPSQVQFTPRQKKYFKQIQFTHYNIITFSSKVKS